MAVHFEDSKPNGHSTLKFDDEAYEHQFAPCSTATIVKYDLESEDEEDKELSEHLPTEVSLRQHSLGKITSVSSLGTDTDVSCDPDDGELTEDQLLNNDMATAFGTNNLRGSSQKIWKDVLAHIKEEPQSRSGTSTVIVGTEGFDQDLSFAFGIDVQNLRQLFPPEHADQDLRLEHQQLADVVKQIFVEHNIPVPKRMSNIEKMLTRAETNSLVAFLRRMSCLSLSRDVARKLVANPMFTGFFIVLTLYALFVPDFVIWALRSSQDDFFTILNTIVWIFFVIEIIILTRGVNGYYRSIPCALDIVAMLSFISDTWFMKSDLFGADGDRAARMSRQTRLTRLARVARVARITKLVPKIMSCFGHQKKEITNFTLERRLWRAFRYLDGAVSGEITMFDFNILYLTLLQECQRMLGKRDKGDVLREDLSKMHGLTMKAARLSFGSFLTVFRSSTLGKAMYDYHLQDLQDSTGSYAMTHDVADRSSLKVCIGILVLIIMMKLLDAETAETEQSALQVLSMLDIMAIADNYGKDFLYTQISEYTYDSNAMFIFINGLVYLSNSGSPINDPLLPMSVDVALETADRIQAQSGLRVSEVLLACIPDHENCDQNNVRSMSLVNVASTTRTDAAWALLQTVVIVGLLLIFISAFNMGVGRFTKALLRPLRAIVDDMLAMSCLELVQIDIDEMPQTGGKVAEAQEAVHLQKAFKRMCVSIRSWSSYVPPVVVQRLMTCGMEATIGVSRCNVSILFVDIESFEDVCRGLGPTDILNILSTALGHIADEIAHHKGTLLEFIGDEVVAVFGAPTMLRNHSYHCALSALNIHNAFAKMKPITLEDGRPVQVSCKSAVHTATVLAGNVGSKRRMKYGLLGDGVNLTARFKTLNSRYRTQTLATSQLMEDEKVLADFVWRPIDRVAVKGKTEPTTVFELLACSDSDDREQFEVLAETHQEAFKLYHSRCFEEAKAQFEEVHKTLSTYGRQDEPSKQMIRRCTRFIKSPPGPDWDGVERLNKKVFEIEEDPPYEAAKNVLNCEDEGIREVFNSDILDEQATQIALPRENTCGTAAEEHLVQPPPEDLVQITPRLTRSHVATLCGTLCDRKKKMSNDEHFVEHTIGPNIGQGTSYCCRYNFNECANSPNMQCLIPSCSVLTPSDGTDRV